MKGNAITVKKVDQTIDVFVNPRNNLPMSTCFRKEGIDSVAANLGESVVSLQNQISVNPRKNCSDGTADWGMLDSELSSSS